MRALRTLWTGVVVTLSLVALLWAGSAVPARAEDNVRMTPEAALQYMAETPTLFVVDVRTPAEYAEKHLDRAVNIPVEELEGRLREVPTDRPVLIHCRTGIRAERAYNLIRDKKPEVKTMRMVRGNVEELLK